MPGDALSELRVRFVEVLDGSLLDFPRHRAHVVACVLNCALAALIWHDLAEEIARLSKIAVGVVGTMP